VDPVVVQENWRKEPPNLVFLRNGVRELRLEVIQSALPFLVASHGILHLLASCLVYECCGNEDSNQRNGEEEVYRLCAKPWEENFEASMTLLRARSCPGCFKLIGESSLISLTYDLASSHIVSRSLEPAVVIFEIFERPDV